MCGQLTCTRQSSIWFDLVKTRLTEACINVHYMIILIPHTKKHFVYTRMSLKSELWLVSAGNTVVGTHLASRKFAGSGEPRHRPGIVMNSSENWVEWTRVQGHPQKN